MLTEALIYVLRTAFDLFALAALLRFYAQALRAPFRNPIADFVIALTDWAVKPLRRVVPGLLGLDMASFFVAWIAAAALYFFITLLTERGAAIGLAFWPMLAVFALVMLLKLSIYLLMGIVLVFCVLSLFSPYHPIRPFFATLTQRFLKPIQRWVPPVGGVDLTPLILLVFLQVILMVPIIALEHAVAKVLWRGVAM